jgi:hypothetical protein
MSIDLAPFRTAKTLRWVQHTVFEPGRGDDGCLVADDTHELPLDVVTPAMLGSSTVGTPPLSGEGEETVGLAVVDPETLDDVHAAVRAWCREQLKRSDVEFPQ